MNHEEEVEKIRLQIFELLKSRTSEAERYASSIVVRPATEKGYQTKDQMNEVFTIKKSNVPVYVMISIFIVFITAASFLQRSIFPALFLGSFALCIGSIRFIVREAIIDSVTLSPEGISIASEQIRWRDIFQIYTARYPKGRVERNVLWIAMNDGKQKEFDITNIAYSDLGHLIGKYQRLYFKSDNTN